MPLLRCLRNARFLMRSSKTRVSTPPQHNHPTSVSQRILCWAQKSFQKTLNRRWFKACPLRKFTAFTTIDNTCFWMFRAVSLKILTLRTPCFRASYPQGVRVTPVKNHCPRLFICNVILCEEHREVNVKTGNCYVIAVFPLEVCAQ